MQLTKLEIEVLFNIVTSEYINVSTIEELVDYATWSFVATNEDKKLAGALGSLVKKGLVECSTDPENNCRRKSQDQTCWLTAAGVEVIKQLGHTV